MAGIAERLRGALSGVPVRRALPVGGWAVMAGIAERLRGALSGVPVRGVLPVGVVARLAGRTTGE
jgi:hypothetical protein